MGVRPAPARGGALDGNIPLAPGQLVDQMSTKQWQLVDQLVDQMSTKQWQLVDQMSTKQTHRVCLCTQLVAVKKTHQPPAKHKRNKQVKNTEQERRARVFLACKLRPNMRGCLTRRWLLEPL
jgi:hypothetical protein